MFGPTTSHGIQLTYPQPELTSGNMTSITQKFNHTYEPANRLTSVNGQAVQWDTPGAALFAAEKGQHAG